MVAASRVGVKFRSMETPKSGADLLPMPPKLWHPEHPWATKTFSPRAESIAGIVAALAATNRTGMSSATRMWSSARDPDAGRDEMCAEAFIGIERLAITIVGPLRNPDHAVADWDNQFANWLKIVGRPAARGYKKSAPCRES